MFRRLLSFVAVLLVAVSVYAGGAACVIIINCGALKAKAAELYEAVPDLRPEAAELKELEGEICDLGPEIEEYLTPEEKQQVVARAAQAWAFGERIQQFIDSGKHKKSDVDAFGRDIRTFSDDQAAFFRALADRHK